MICDSCSEEIEDEYYHHFDNISVCEYCKDNEGTCPKDEPKNWYRFDELFYFKADQQYYKNSAIKSHWHHKENNLYKKLDNSKSGKYLGFELELITPNAVSVANKISNKDIFIEYDGSLEAEGFEICSKYGDIEDVLELAENTAKSLRSFKGVKSESSQSCGLHVHLSKTIFNNDELAKFIVFWNDPCNAPYLKKFTRRWRGDNYFDSYSKVNQNATIKNLIDQGTKYILSSNSERKLLINSVSNDKTIEIRGFKGTINPVKFCSCLELSYYSSLFVKESTIKELKFGFFTNWLKDTKSSFIRKML